MPEVKTKNDDSTLTLADLQRQYDRSLAEALKSAPTGERPGIVKNFGVFGNDPKKYRVLCDALGQHGRGELITASDLAIWHAKPSPRGGSEPDYDKVDVRATKANIDRLMMGKNPAIEAVIGG